jgi:hypothetical protein
MSDLNWLQRAACRRRPDLDWFDLDCNLEPCLQVCVTCTVADDCLDYAIEYNCREGMWGGEWGYRLAAYIRAGGRG